jgi:hypothetical protein
MQVNLTSRARQTILESLEASLYKEHVALARIRFDAQQRAIVFADINRLVEALTRIHPTFTLAEFRLRQFPGYLFPATK